MSVIKICMIGAAGRMGRRIIALASENEGTQITGAVEYSGSSFLNMDAGEVAAIGKIGVNILSDIEEASKDSDVIIDFTGFEATMSNIDIYKRLGKPIVVGSTGLSKTDVEKLKDLSNDIPVLFSPNMSVGVNLTFKVLEMVSKAIGEQWDIEIIEAHHRLKKDAPSGTAMRMGEVVANAIGRDIEKDGMFCRHGLIGERTDKEIGMQTLRAGDIVGEHTVMFCTEGERIEITHRAHTRDMFAKGAIQAAKWIADKPKNFYNMFDVLNI
jgi:4-hydroxy-tetrahydrodipicolinate reductase